MIEKRENRLSDEKDRFFEYLTNIKIRNIMDLIFIKLEFPARCVLVLGNEKEGIPFEVISHLDVVAEIPQEGLIRSLNVHVSAAIAIWEFTRNHIDRA